MASLHAFRSTLITFGLLVSGAWLILLFDPIRLLGWSNTARWIICTAFPFIPGLEKVSSSLGTDSDKPPPTTFGEWLVTSPYRSSGINPLAPFHSQVSCNIKLTFWGRRKHHRKLQLDFILYEPYPFRAFLYYNWYFVTSS